MAVDAAAERFIQTLLREWAYRSSQKLRGAPVLARTVSSLIQLPSRAYRALLQATDQSPGGYAELERHALALCRLVTMDRFSSSTLKVKRARDLLDNLENRVQADQGGEAYSARWDQSREPEEFVVRAVLKQPIDPTLGVMTGEIAHHLRSCLDYAVGTLIEFGTGRPAPESHNFAFPIFNRREHNTLAKIRSATRGVPEAVANFIETAQPYNRTNPEAEPLWLLHRIDVESKHRALHVLLGATLLTGVRLTGSATSDVYAIPEKWLNRPLTFPVEDGTELFSFSRANDEGGINIQMDFFVAFGNPHPAKGLPVLAVLESCTREVERVLDGLRELVVANV